MRCDEDTDVVRGGVGLVELVWMADGCGCWVEDGLEGRLVLCEGLSALEGGGVEGLGVDEVVRVGLVEGVRVDEVVTVGLLDVGEESVEEKLLSESRRIVDVVSRPEVVDGSSADGIWPFEEV